MNQYIKTSIKIHEKPKNKKDIPKTELFVSLKNFFQNHFSQLYVDEC